MLPEIRPLPSTSKTSPGRRVSRKPVKSFGVNGSQLAGFCNRAIKRPTISNIRPMTRSLLQGRCQTARLSFGHLNYTSSVIMRDGPDHCTEVDPIRYIGLRSAYQGLRSATPGPGRDRKGGQTGVTHPSNRGKRSKFEFRNDLAQR